MNLDKMNTAKNIIKEMMMQRKYEFDTEENDTLIYNKPDNNQIIIFFSDTDKFNVKNIQLFISVMNNLDIFHAIIVYKDGVTSFTKKAIEQSVEIKFELFAMEDLQYNITKHRLQPQFIKLNNVEEFKKKYGTKFPILKIDDPISKFYAYEKGDIIKVVRKNNTINYRIVK